MLQLDDIRSFLQSFWIRHLNGRSFSTVAKQTSLAETTIKRFAAGEPNIGFYNLYQIIHALGVSFLTFARELLGWELKKALSPQDDQKRRRVLQSSTVSDRNGASLYGTRRTGDGPEEGTDRSERASEEEILKAAEDMIGRAESLEALRGTLAESLYQTDRQDRINRVVAAYLKKDHDSLSH